MSALGQKRTYAMGRDVRFTPESGHVQSATSKCPLSAKRISSDAF